MTARKAITKSLRFEIFKRDRFSCSYCGRTPPEVLLHVDHVIPVVDGGTNDPENLTTSCQDCNLGKGPRSLEAGIRPGPSPDDLEERIEQAKAYLALMAQVQDIRGKLLDLVMEQWAKAWGGGINEAGDAYTMPQGGYWPEDATIKVLLKRLPLDAIYEAIDITAGRFPGRASWDSTKYFYGVCWRMVRTREGRE